MITETYTLGGIQGSVIDHRLPDCIRKQSTQICLSSRSTLYWNDWVHWKMIEFGWIIFDPPNTSPIFLEPFCVEECPTPKMFPPKNCGTSHSPSSITTVSPRYRRNLVLEGKLTAQNPRWSQLLRVPWQILFPSGSKKIGSKHLTHSYLRLNREFLCWKF